MRIGPPWHEEARKLRAEGLGYTEIARRMGKSNTSVRTACDQAYYRRQLEHNRGVKERERQRLRGESLPDRKKIRQEQRAVQRAYAEPSEKTPAPLTLPKISMPLLLDEQRSRIVFAPKTRLTGSPGAERWRAIHQDMKRRGLVAERDILTEWRQ